MAITIDANVLISAANDGDVRHEPARGVIESLPGDGEIVYLFWPVITAYIRVTTHRALLGSPFTLDEAWGNVRELAALPRIRIAPEPADFLDQFADVAIGQRAAGRLIHDAHIVALMRHYEVGTIWTYDADFRRFDGIRVVEPGAP